MAKKSQLANVIVTDDSMRYNYRLNELRDLFDDDFDHLIIYKYQHGKFNDLHIHEPALYGWVKGHERLYQANELDSYRHDKFNQIGITFSKRFNSASMSVMDRIACLIRFRDETGGDTPSKYHAIKEYASLAQWLTRTKRAFNGGTLDSSVIEALKEVGIVFAPPSTQYQKIGEVAEEKAFKENMENLYGCIADLRALGLPKDFKLKDINSSHEMRKAYRFLEHAILKSRNGKLKVEHANKMLDAKFSMNGVEFEYLLYSKSKRPR